MEKQPPHIVIITRTSNRPESHLRCVTSVKNQTYKTISHFHLCDNGNDIVKYVSKNVELNKIIEINSDDLKKQYNTPNPNTGKYSPHNLYFNYFQDNFLPSNSWVIYLDDDDYLIDENAIQKIVDVINKNDEDTLIFFKMNLMGNIIPTIVNNENYPRIGTIGSSCLTFNSKYKQYATWDEWKCGDYRVIEKLFKVIPKNVFIDEVIAVAEIANNGNKKDI